MKHTAMILYFLGCIGFAQHQIPTEVLSVLKKAGKNSYELEKVIRYYKERNEDSLKLKAAYFLIANMDIHSSQNFYWVDENNKRLPYNELDYQDFSTAISAFDNIKTNYKQVKPKAVNYKDIDTITATYLIKNIDNAFEKWHYNALKKITFSDFCDYILPYRVGTEPLQDWRNLYSEKFSWVHDSVKDNSTEDALKFFTADFRSWFVNTWLLEQRKEPLPKLGPLQLLSRKKGNCDDIGNLMVYMLRSQGYPASVEYVPYWATATGSHFFNSTYASNGKLIPFDVSTAQVKIDNFSREPSKVIRFMYAKQPGTLASFLDKDKIPPGFMRMENYLDVTPNYWETHALTTPVFKLKAEQPKVAFVCVLNGLKWQPTWWGNIDNEKVTFNNLCKGAVFLPVYYINNNIVPAAYPIDSGYHNQLTLKPDFENKKDIIIKEQDKYLKFRSEKKYTLYYWNNTWVKHDEKTTDATTTELKFESVPNNALLLLVPEYSQGKERPFIITNNHERVWF